ncbi:MAG: hypothetical protein JNK05_41790 [Myxococcales bacterium]|nr:hypothetical protein [Myxococcales bacterium]
MTEATASVARDEARPSVRAAPVADNVVDDRPLSEGEVVASGVRVSVPRGWRIERRDHGVFMAQSPAGGVFAIGADRVADAAAYQTVRLSLLFNGLAQGVRFSNERSAPEWGPSARRVRGIFPAEVRETEYFVWIGQTRSRRELGVTCSGGYGDTRGAFCTAAFARLSTRAPANVEANETVLSNGALFAVVPGEWRRATEQALPFVWDSGEGPDERVMILTDAPAAQGASPDVERFRQQMADRGEVVRDVRLARVAGVQGVLARVVREITTRRAVVQELATIHHEGRAIVMTCSVAQDEEGELDACERMTRGARLVSREFERRAPDPFRRVEEGGVR